MYIFHIHIICIYIWKNIRHSDVNLLWKRPPEFLKTDVIQHLISDLGIVLKFKCH